MEAPVVVSAVRAGDTGPGVVQLFSCAARFKQGSAVSSLAFSVCFPCYSKAEAIRRYLLL